MTIPPIISVAGVILSAVAVVVAAFVAGLWAHRTKTVEVRATVENNEQTHMSEARTSLFAENGRLRDEMRRDRDDARAEAERAEAKAEKLQDKVDKLELKIDILQDSMREMRGIMRGLVDTITSASHVMQDNGLPALAVPDMPPDFH